jgi:hypothetical protein
MLNVHHPLSLLPLRMTVRVYSVDILRVALWEEHPVQRKMTLRANAVSISHQRGMRALEMKDCGDVLERPTLGDDILYLTFRSLDRVRQRLQPPNRLCLLR